MAVKTDEENKDTKLWIEYLPNGDFHLNLMEKMLLPDADKPHLVRIDFQVAMDNGSIPYEVRMAVVTLWRAMELAGLNNHPSDDGE